MNPSVDELAGVVDLFGGLTREELDRALSELAFRTDGDSIDDEALEETVETAVSEFALVRYDVDGRDEPLLVAGPTAFPSTPEHAEDLPHILEVEPRDFDREALGGAARRRFTRAVEDALAEGSDDRVRRLLDASYDLEAWAPIDLSNERERLDDTLE